jgi:hypothetical protein
MKPTTLLLLTLALTGAGCTPTPPEAPPPTTQRFVREYCDHVDAGVGFVRVIHDTHTGRRYLYLNGGIVLMPEHPQP